MVITRRNTQQQQQEGGGASPAWPPTPAAYTRRRKERHGSTPTPEAVEAARKHIEEIRRSKFSIGAAEPNPLTADLHHAVRNLSAELYTKDVHFVMELIQNAEDNAYPEGTVPSLEFVMTPNDITGTGATATLLVFNNEVGFSRSNVESICSVGRSTKKGRRKEGYIGEKGIGFKSVFLVCKHVYIFSNGYQIKFQEEPNKSCSIGFIVPGWVNEKPSLPDLQKEYGSNILPTTTIILPLRIGKIESVRKQLSEVHPEILLFLSKIRHLSICENAKVNLSPDSMSKISISSETDVAIMKDKNAKSHIIYLSAQIGHDRTQHDCHYYMWQQKFPVKAENRVDARMDIDELVISLAFPLGQRLQRGSSCSSIYAFLPTSMVTNFPFIIHADFILASSRETIQLDNRWNLGILGAVPVAFANAFKSYLASKNVKAIPTVFEFLPTHSSFISELENVRNSIKTLVMKERILPCEPLLEEQKVFSEPSKVVKLLPSFLDLLYQVKEKGESLAGFLRDGIFVLDRSLCFEKYDYAMEFLGLDYVCFDWYLKCMNDSNLLLQVADDLYLEILRFVARNFQYTKTVENIPLLRHVTAAGTCLCSISQAKRKVKNICCASLDQYAGWLSKCNMKFGCRESLFFLPDAVQIPLVTSDKNSYLRYWLFHDAGVQQISLIQYIRRILPLVRKKKSPKLVILFTCFLYHCHSKCFLTRADIFQICRPIPVLDKNGNVHSDQKITLPPGSCSRWSKLLGPNPFKDEGYIELGEIYAQGCKLLGEHASMKAFMKFIIKFTKAEDLPNLHPPDAALPSAFSQLTGEQAILLLNWVKNLKVKGINLPAKFVNSIKCGKWLKTISGFGSPSQCILLDESGKSILSKVGSLLACLPVIDEKYYNSHICQYRDELSMLGVQLGCVDVWKLIVDHLESLALSELTVEMAISLLAFIRSAKQYCMLDDDVLKKLKGRNWLKTSQGYRSPEGTVLVHSDMMAVSQISTLSIVDEAYYGSEIGNYVAELKLLGVVVDVDQLYKNIVDSFKFPEILSDMSRESVLLILSCIKNLGPSSLSFAEIVKCKPWLKTNLGFCCPSESLLYNPSMDQILSIIEVPLIDENFYGSGIHNFLDELQAIGVVLDFTGAIKRAAVHFKAVSSLCRLTGTNVISLLRCIKLLGGTTPLLLSEFKTSLAGETWLKTRHGYQSAPNSILFDSKWGTISQFVDLPIIDDAFYGIGIYEFRRELQMMGVVLDFSEGHHFVAAGLNFPRSYEIITGDATYSILQCIGHMMQNASGGPLPPDFVCNIRENKWLKTHMGYRSPEDSLLFDSDWSSVIEPGDGPFIDETFYGARIFSYVDTLKAIGVKNNVKEVCQQISKVLTLKNDDQVITRLYWFLNVFEWRSTAGDKSNSRVWIPSQNGTPGKWVSCSICVLHDPYSLISSQLHVLDKYYEEALLPIFSSVFGVAESPVLKYYIHVWKEWEANDQNQVNSAECSSFWAYILTHWDIVDIIKMGIVKLPSCTALGGRVQLIEKDKLFIPDDLELENLFTESCSGPLFVWYPLHNSAAAYLSKFYCICDGIGVRKLSESVKLISDSCLMGEDVERLDLVNGLISKGLVRLVTAFLSVKSEMVVNERHSSVKALLDLKIYATGEPVTVKYELAFADKHLIVSTNRSVHWTGSGSMIVCLPNWEDEEESIEFVIYFARAISEKILGKNGILFNDLCRMIETGFFTGFDNRAQVVLLRTQNLKISPEDEDFIDGVFLPVQSCMPATKRKLSPGTWVERSPSLSTLEKKIKFEN